jgi:hypothetical protein
LRTLYIYGGENDLKVSANKSDFCYHLNTGLILDKAKCIDDSKAIHDIALNIRDKYVDYINSLNNLFVKNNLIYNNEISIFYFSDLFNKRTEIFTTYISLCHVIYLKEYLFNNPVIKSIQTVECPSSFNIALASILDDRIKFRTLKEEREIPSLLKSYARHFKYFIVSIIKLVLIKSLYSRPLKIHSKSLFLTRYPLHFDMNYREEKYGDLIKKNDSYLISILTDGMHQNIGLRDIIIHAKDLSNRNNFILLESYLKIIDLLLGLINSIILENRSKNLYNNNYYFEGINIKKFILKEIQYSFKRIPRLFCYRSAIRKAFLNIRPNKFIFYLHEYSYGKYFNYVVAKYFPNIERIGFQHGPASRRKLLYYLGKDIVSNSPDKWLHSTPIPDKVISEDKLSKFIYEESGYNNVEIMKKVYRLNYIKLISRLGVQKDIILLVPGLHDGVLLIRKLFNHITSHPEKRFIFKAHPRGCFKSELPSKYHIENLELGTAHITQYLTYVSEVFVTYSSVGVEAYNLGIPVKVICFQNQLNESPLIDIYQDTYKSAIDIQW